MIAILGHEPRYVLHGLAFGVYPAPGAGRSGAESARSLLRAAWVLLNQTLCIDTVPFQTVVTASALPIASTDLVELAADWLPNLIELEMPNRSEFSIRLLPSPRVSFEASASKPSFELVVSMRPYPRVHGESALRPHGAAERVHLLGGSRRPPRLGVTETARVHKAWADLRPTLPRDLGEVVDCLHRDTGLAVPVLVAWLGQGRIRRHGDAFVVVAQPPA